MCYDRLTNSLQKHVLCRCTGRSFWVTVSESWHLTRPESLAVVLSTWAYFDRPMSAWHNARTIWYHWCTYTFTWSQVVTFTLVLAPTHSLGHNFFIICRWQKFAPLFFGISSIFQDVYCKTPSMFSTVFPPWTKLGRLFDCWNGAWSLSAVQSCGWGKSELGGELGIAGGDFIAGRSSFPMPCLKIYDSSKKSW